VTRPPGGSPPRAPWAPLLLVAFLLSPIIVLAWAAGMALLRLTGWKRWPLALAAVAAGGIAVWWQGGLPSALAHHFSGPESLLRQWGAPVVHFPLPGAFLWPQAPLAVPAGLLAASLSRDRGELLGPELDTFASRRRAKAERKAQAKARRLADRSSERNVKSPGPGAALAVAISGDLPDDWRHGKYLALPARVAALPRLVVGRPGQGKTVYLGREVYLAAADQRRATVIDCKGEATFATEITDAYLAGRPQATVHIWPDEPLNGWVGGPAAVVNRLLSCWEWDLAAQWYREVVSMALRLALHAPGPQVASSTELVARMRPGALTRLWAGHRDEQDWIKAHAEKFHDVAVRVTNLMASLGRTLDGAEPLGTADLTVLSLPVMALEHDAASILRVAMADLAHHVAVRKPHGDRELVVVDEFSAVPGGREHAIHLAERGRSAGVATVLAVQSRRGLGDDDDADRLIGATGLVVLFATAEPEDVLKLAGTVRQVEIAAQLEDGALTGRGTATVRSGYRVDANVVRALAPGQAFLLAGGRAELAQIIRPPQGLTRPQSMIVGAPAPHDRPAGLRSPVGGTRALRSRVKAKLAALVPPAALTRPLGPGPETPTPPAGGDSPTDDRDDQEES
jgi:hypothetical protein